MLRKVKDFMGQNLRVLQISSKPKMDEFRSASKITGMGILLIGSIGFLIYLVFNIAGLFQ